MRAYCCDFNKANGFRCVVVEILEGPLEDSFLGEITFYYRVQFPDGLVNDIPAYHIFDQPIELIDLPKECYWGEGYDY